MLRLPRALLSSQKVLDNLRAHVSTHGKTLGSFRGKGRLSVSSSCSDLGRYQPCANLEQTENDVKRHPLEIHT